MRAVRLRASSLCARPPSKKAEPEPLISTTERHQMQLTINGETRSIEPPLTLAALIEQLGFKLDRVAVEYNRAILPRAKWLETSLAEGDRLEIVQFVGGGAQ
jgi:sulfur carrier protein